MTPSDKMTTLYCSFCGKSQHEVFKLVAGPTVFICDECVDLCLGIFFSSNVTPGIRTHFVCPAVEENLRMIQVDSLDQLLANTSLPASGPWNAFELLNAVVSGLNQRLLPPETFIGIQAEIQAITETIGTVQREADVAYTKAIADIQPMLEKIRLLQTGVALTTSVSSVAEIKTESRPDD